MVADKKYKHVVQYTVDSAGQGTHKTITEALADAAKKPDQLTMIRIKTGVTFRSMGANRGEE